MMYSIRAVARRQCHKVFALENPQQGFPVKDMYPGIDVKWDETSLLSSMVVTTILMVNV